MRRLVVFALALVCCEQAGAAATRPPDSPLPDPRFREVIGEAAKSSPACLTTVCDPLTCSETQSLTTDLEWGEGPLVSRSGIYDLESIRIEFEPRHSFESKDRRHLAAPLRFRGNLIVNDSGTEYAIEQDHVGEFDARSVFHRDWKSVQFLLPSLFRRVGSPEEVSHGILAFTCDEKLISCERPTLGFEPYLQRMGRRATGLPSERARELPASDSLDQPMVPKCCYDPYFIQCACRMPAISCSNSTAGQCPVDVFDGCVYPSYCWCPECPIS